MQTKDTRISLNAAKEAICSIVGKCDDLDQIILKKAIQEEIEDLEKTETFLLTRCNNVSTDMGLKHILIRVQNIFGRIKEYNSESITDKINEKQIELEMQNEELISPTLESDKININSNEKKTAETIKTINNNHNDSYKDKVIKIQIIAILDEISIVMGKVYFDNADYKARFIKECLDIFDTSNDKIDSWCDFFLFLRMKIPEVINAEFISKEKIIGKRR